MGIGICIVGVGLLVGLVYDNLKVETTYLVAGVILFGVGRLLEGRKKA
ncbi:MAG TPA: hypothetical protein VMU54_12485 [Planctomycetota bacterium]|nr:hypothetical protein [Planctomycetota bacterium]